MRQRDIIYTRPEQAQDEIMRSLRDAWASTQRIAGARFERHLDERTDPIATTRAYGAIAQDFLDMLWSLSPDSIDKTWTIARHRELQGNRTKRLTWKARALGINPDQHDIDLALSGMTPLHDGERWLLAVALPAPPPLGAPKYIVEDLVLIDPKTGTAQLSGVHDPSVILPVEHDRFTVHGDARVWAREFATARLEWFYSRRRARELANIEPIWLGFPPSALAIGDPRKIIWPHAEVITAGQGIDSKALVAAVRRQFHLPRIHTPTRTAA